VVNLKEDIITFCELYFRSWHLENLRISISYNNQRSMRKNNAAIPYGNCGGLNEYGTGFTSRTFVFPC
jgi:hypothetical protein